MCKVANNAEIVGERVRCVVAVCKELHVRIDVRGERLFGEPIDVGVLG